jgi:hypothetical protein
MYSTLPSFVLGFHGCDESIRDNVIKGKERLKNSENNYDWIGHGIYFWENNPRRAMEYAKLIKENPGRSSSKIKKAAVVGAVIDLGYCLNLFESESLEYLKESYNLLQYTQELAGLSLPENKSIDEESDLLLRKLDCAVIETLHTYNRENNLREYDTVRFFFWKEKNYIQMQVLKKKITYKFVCVILIVLKVFS